MGLAQRGTEWCTRLWTEGHTLSSGRHARIRMCLCFSTETSGAASETITYRAFPLRAETASSAVLILRR